MKAISKITILLLAMSMIFINCKKDDDSTPTNPDTPDPTTSLGYFTGIVDGTNVSYEVGIDDIINGGTASQILLPLPDTSMSSFGAYLEDQTTGEYVFHIQKGTLRFAPAPSPDNGIFKDFFGVGTYSFSQFAESGFEGELYDNNGTLWSTSLGTALQPGSFVEIEEISEITQFNNYYIRARISFSCRIYDDAGNSKQLTDGKFLGEFENI